MLILIASVTLVFVGFVIYLVIHYRPHYPLTWLICVGTSFLAWILVLLSRWLSNQPIILVGWLPFSLLGSTVTLVVDSISWPYAFSLATILLAVLLTRTVENLPSPSSNSWPASMLITGIGLLVMLVGNPLTLVLAWAAIDIVEFSIIIRSINEKDMLNRTVLSFGSRVLGVFIASWSMFGSQTGLDVLTFNEITPDVGVFVLLASGLRLGVIPLHLPYTRELYLRRGFGTMLRLLAPASSLVVLARLPAAVVEPVLAIYLLIFTALASLYGAFMWLTSSDELSGRPYWLLALAGMSVASVIRGRPEASIGWGLSLILVGGLVFLYSSRRKETRLLVPFLALLGLSGLPYTPSSSGWDGLVVLPFTPLDVIFLITHVLLMIGTGRLLMKPGDSIKGYDRWLQIFYFLGLLILIISHWIINISGWVELSPNAPWWAPLITTTITVVVILFSLQNVRFGGIQNPLKRLSWINYFWKFFGSKFSAFFSLEWIYRFVYRIFRLLQTVIGYFTELLEGQGGILWTILFLVLVVTILIEWSVP